MSADLKLLTLYREAIHKPDKGTDKGSARRLLTMDYFDALEVKSFSFDKDSIRDFLGFCADDALSENDVTMQSIPLYCPSADVRQGDPFENEGKGAYLSLLLVYITPEVLHRFNYGQLTNKGSAASDVYDLFYSDIHEALDEYVEKNTDIGISYRIYKSLSLGDFVVAIRSPRLDVTFQVIEMLRRRRSAGIEGAGDDASMMLYKTYTIISVNNRVIETEERDESKEGAEEDTVKGSQGQRAEKGHFVLRAVLSNLYWHDEEKIKNDERLKEMKLPGDFLRSGNFSQLNGRYDFSVNLSEQDFLNLLPCLEEFKLEVFSHQPDLCKKVSGDENKVCSFLKYLISEGYISHVNERYVAVYDSVGIDGLKYESTISLLPQEDGKYLNEVIAEEIKKLEKRIKEIHLSVMEMETSRRSISYSMRLLERLTNTCSAINGISDTRIYASILVRLGNAALNGLEGYLAYYNEKFDLDIIGAIDKELREEVEALDAFSEYILDNNLQSLQSPNYNLESHTSVEKLMMSYSEFLRQLVDWYRKSEFAKNIEGMREEYETIMVPHPLDASLSIKVFSNRLKEKNKEDEKLKKLLVVFCPSFYELADFESSMGMLFHEIGHYMRYEDRKTRNDFIIQYSSQLLFDPVADSIVVGLRRDIPRLSDVKEIRRGLNECLSKAYFACLTAKSGIYDNMPLTVLLKQINSQFAHFTKSVSTLTTLWGYIKDLLPEKRNKFEEEELKEKDKFLPVEYKQFLEKILSKGTCCPEEKVLKDFADDYLRIFTRIGDFSYKESSAFESKKSLEDAVYLYGIQDESLRDVELSSDNDEAMSYESLKDLMKSFLMVSVFREKLNKYAKEWIEKIQDTPDGRKIARYLSMGAYARLDGSEKDFFFFVASDILKTESESNELLANNIFLYREVTADLFLIRMLNLDSFGYFNVVTRNLPSDGGWGETYMLRICRVLYAIENGKERTDNKTWDSVWLKIFQSMCLYIGKVIKKYVDKQSNGGQEQYGYLMVKKKNIPVIEYLTEFVKVAEKYGAEKLTLNKTLDVSNDFVDYLRAFREAAAKEYSEISKIETSGGKERLKNLETYQGDLQHCCYLCMNYLQLVYEYPSIMESINGSTFRNEKILGDDLIRGNEALIALQKEFASSDLWKKYGKVICDAYNNGSWEGSQVMTEFVLEMHYASLLRGAKRVSWEERNYVDK